MSNFNIIIESPNNNKNNYVISSIITLFNESYKYYLDGELRNTILEMFISKSLLLLLNKETMYILDLTNDKQLKDYNRINLMFNNDNVGTLYINSNTLPYEFNIFITYLSMLIYNINIIQYEKIIKSNIFIETLNTISDGILILNRSFTILYSNKNADIILKKISNNQICLNMKIFEAFTQLEDILKNEHIYKNKKINYKINKDNIDINLLLTINTIIYDNIQYNILLINPNSINTRSDNIGFLSHELRNPLQTITFANQLIQMKIDTKSNTNKYLNIIDKSVYDMTKIINDVLDIDRINSNQINLNLEDISLNEIIDDIKFNFEHYLESFMKTNDNIDIKFNIVLEDNLPKKIYTDLTRIKQILTNILNNSIKYSKNNSINIITLTISKDNKYIKFSVKDTGIGIKSEHIQNLMDVKPLITYNKQNSNGFGLYLCNKIVSLLGGKIEINSKYTTGSEFIITLPIHYNSIDYNLSIDIEKTNIFNKILIIDSNESLCILFKDIINNLKFKYNINTTDLIIDYCTNGSHVCDMVNLNNYDIIFMDLYMKDITGITLVKLLRKQQFNKKIVGTCSDSTYIINDFNSISPSNSLKLKSLKNEESSQIYQLLDDIIIKPFNEKDIFDALKY